MKIPRDVHGDDLITALRVLGYRFDRQDGSHVRISTQLNGEHHLTIPRHKPLKIGTLVKGVLKPVAAHHHLSVEELLRKLVCKSPNWKSGRRPSAQTRVTRAALCLTAVV